MYAARSASVDDLIALERTPYPFGGWRWWFTCPMLGCRVGKIYLPSSGQRFASRWAWRLACQNNRDPRLQQTFAVWQWRGLVVKIGEGRGGMKALAAQK